jgi:outer membrane protein assembly factor BamB
MTAFHRIVSIQGFSMRFFTLLLVLVFPSKFMAGDDWSRWLGPGENNQVEAAANFQPDFGTWKVAWRAEVGLGYSTVTTSGQRAITLGHDGDKQESVVCLDLETGHRLWEYRYSAERIPIAHPGGPNASATIVGDSLFTLSKDGQLHSLSLEDGTVRWKVNLVDLLGVEIPRWGFACSPLLHGENLILSAGKLTALDSTTGKPLWINESGWKAGYATPRLFQYEGLDYLAAMDADGLSVFKASDGSEVARHRIRGIKHGVTANTPVALEEGRKLLLHTNGGSSLLAFDGSRLKPFWEDRKLQNSLSGFLVRDGVF